MFQKNSASFNLASTTLSFPILISPFLSLLFAITTNSFVISFGFMADLVNVFFLKNKFSISSVRGNLSLNYYYDFNFLGKI